MVLRASVQRCGNRPRRFIGLPSRSSIPTTAASSSQCQQSLRRNDDCQQTPTLRWSSHYCLRPLPPSRPTPPPRPLSRWVAGCSTAVNSWSSGAIDIASGGKEHRSHNKQRHHSTRSGNRTLGTTRSLSRPPQLLPWASSASNRSSIASSARKNSTDSRRDGSDSKGSANSSSRGVSDSKTSTTNLDESDSKNTKSDTSNEGALLKMLGPRWSPYGRLARIDKPAGSLLLLFPCWWSIALAAPMNTLPDLKLMALFATGAVVMRSAGCTINDLWDRDLDVQVARTKSRPLASGELGTTQALAFLGGQLTLGLGVLVNLNVECIKLGFAVMPLVVAYPLMKRYTDWPQAFLGLTFNWGAIMGWAAVHESVSWEHVLPLYGAGVCWTLVYDTLYGHQDKADDKRLGMRSTALLFGERTKPVLSGFAAASVGLLGASGFAAGLSWPFYVGTAAAAGHLAWQIGSADLEDPAGLFKIFRSNQEFGALIFASIVCGHF